MQTANLSTDSTVCKIVWTEHKLEEFWMMGCLYSALKIPKICGSKIFFDGK